MSWQEACRASFTKNLLKPSFSLDQGGTVYLVFAAVITLGSLDVAILHYNETDAEIQNAENYSFI